MSFFSNQTQRCCNQNANADGINSAGGSCEKICVELKRVFDACMKQDTIEEVSVTLTDLTPSSPTDPLKFLSAHASGEVTLENLVITPVDGKHCQARVRADAVVGIKVNYVDSDCTKGEGTSSVTVPVDVVLNVPHASILPYSVNAQCGLVSPSGVYDSDNTFTIVICYTLIVKITMDVDVVIPVYGYCQVPQCQDYSEEVCTDFFELPLYPRLSRR